MFSVHILLFFFFIVRCLMVVFTSLEKNTFYSNHTLYRTLLTDFNPLYIGKRQKCLLLAHAIAHCVQAIQSEYTFLQTLKLYIRYSIRTKGYVPRKHLLIKYMRFIVRKIRTNHEVFLTSRYLRRLLPITALSRRSDNWLRRIMKSILLKYQIGLRTPVNRVGTYTVASICSYLMGRFRMSRTFKESPEVFLDMYQLSIDMCIRQMYGITARGLVRSFAKSVSLSESEWSVKTISDAMHYMNYRIDYFLRTMCYFSREAIRTFIQNSKLMLNGYPLLNRSQFICRYDYLTVDGIQHVEEVSQYTQNRWSIWFYFLYTFNRIFTHWYKWLRSLFFDCFFYYYSTSIINACTLYAYNIHTLFSYDSLNQMSTWRSFFQKRIYVARWETKSVTNFNDHIYLNNLIVRDLYVDPCTFVYSSDVFLQQPQGGYFRDPRLFPVTSTDVLLRYTSLSADLLKSYYVEASTWDINHAFNYKFDIWIPYFSDVFDDLILSAKQLSSRLRFKFVKLNFLVRTSELNQNSILGFLQLVVESLICIPNISRSILRTKYLRYFETFRYVDLSQERPQLYEYIRLSFCLKMDLTSFLTRNFVPSGTDVLIRANFYTCFSSNERETIGVSRRVHHIFLYNIKSNAGLNGALLHLCRTSPIESILCSAYRVHR